jgi:hypothetical protein
VSVLSFLTPAITPALELPSAERKGSAGTEDFSVSFKISNGTLGIGLQVYGPAESNIVSTHVLIYYAGASVSGEEAALGQSE